MEIFQNAGVMKSPLVIEWAQANGMEVIDLRFIPEFPGPVVGFLLAVLNEAAKQVFRAPESDGDLQRLMAALNYTDWYVSVVPDSYFDTY